MSRNLDESQTILSTKQEKDNLGFTDKPALASEFEANDFFDLTNMPFDYSSHTIFGAYQGSISYGTNTPTSDVDIRGVMIAPERYFLGMNKFNQAENQKKDVTYFNLPRFFQLAYASNPHSLETLFVDKRHIIECKPIFEKVIANRHMFLSQGLGYSFGGYAHEQLRQITIKKDNDTGRQALIQKFGYDTKMAAHALRLYRSGAEALETGDLTVFRPDAEELLAIRNGKYSLEEFAIVEKYQQTKVGKDGKEIKKNAVRIVGGLLKAEEERFRTALDNTKLPKLPDYHKLNAFLVELLKEHFGWA